MRAGNDALGRGHSQRKGSRECTASTRALRSVREQETGRGAGMGQPALKAIRMGLRSWGELGKELELHQLFRSALPALLGFSGGPHVPLALSQW